MHYRIKSVLNIIFCSCLLLSLCGCGATVNLVKILHSSTSTFLVGNPISEVTSIVGKKIFVRMANLSVFTEPKFVQFESAIIGGLQASNYDVVSDIDEADAVITIVFRNFTTIDDVTISNMKKYVQYKDSIGVIKKDQLSVGGSSINFAMIDDGIAISSRDGIEAKGNSTFSKIMAVDFVSGIALGALVGYLIGGINPVSIVLGGLVGSVITSIAQIVTRQASYSSTIDIKLEVRSNEVSEVKTKIVSQMSDNAVKEIYTNKKSDWVEYKSTMIVVKEAAFTKRIARNAIMKNASVSVLNVIK